MTSWWQRLARIGRGKVSNPPLITDEFFPSFPSPTHPVAIVGDIHGRADLLENLLKKVSEKAPDAKVVFVGDYVDRGPDSRKVLDRLRGLDGAVYLRGNHEVMLLEFLDEPIELGGRWLRNGGINTLESFGIDLEENPSHGAAISASQRLKAALAEGGEAWLRGLPLTWQSGNLVVTHAGPNPVVPIEQQKEQDLLWGHHRFLRDSRKDGIWVAHGHWIREKAISKGGRINVDTGAWKTGRLTAALIGTQGDITFIHSDLTV
ncbi:MAG: metallophosphoesterase family protein [Paracoccaceae bacterium]